MGYNKRRPLTPTRRPSRGKPSVQAFYTPFKGLDQYWKDISRAKCNQKHGQVSVAGTFAPQENEEQLFFQHMSDVIPLPVSRRDRIPPPSPAQNPVRFLAQEEMEVHAHLTGLVCGEVAFELTLSDEYTDGAVVGLPPDVLTKLRRGEFSYQDHTDLHGCTRKEARQVVIQFVQESFARGLRCVLIVSGRGLNSRDKIPVLKHGVVRWLTQSPLKRLILAFASARCCDGGAGAFYVLLRRNEEKSAFITRGL